MSLRRRKGGLRLLLHHLIYQTHPTIRQSRTKKKATAKKARGKMETARYTAGFRSPPGQESWARSLPCALVSACFVDIK